MTTDILTLRFQLTHLEVGEDDGKIYDIRLMGILERDLNRDNHPDDIIFKSLDDYPIEKAKEVCTFRMKAALSEEEGWICIGCFTDLPGLTPVVEAEHNIINNILDVLDDIGLGSFMSDFNAAQKAKQHVYFYSSPIEDDDEDDGDLTS